MKAQALERGKLAFRTHITSIPPPYLDTSSACPCYSGTCISRLGSYSLGRDSMAFTLMPSVSPLPLHFLQTSPLCCGFLLSFAMLLCENRAEFVLKSVPRDYSVLQKAVCIKNMFVLAGEEVSRQTAGCSGKLGNINRHSALHHSR